MKLHDVRNHEILVVFELILKLMDLFIALVFSKLLPGKIGFIESFVSLAYMTLDLDFIALGLQVVDDFSIRHVEVGSSLFAEASVLLGSTFARHLVGFHFTLAVDFAWSVWLAFVLEYNELVEDREQNFIFDPAE